MSNTGNMTKTGARLHKKIIRQGVRLIKQLAVLQAEYQRLRDAGVIEPVAFLEPKKKV